MESVAVALEVAQAVAKPRDPVPVKEEVRDGAVVNVGGRVTPSAENVKVD